MNLSKSLCRISKIKVETVFNIYHSIKDYQTIDFLPGIMCTKNDSNSVMIRHDYDEKISSLNNSILPQPIYTEGKNYIRDCFTIDFEKVPKNLSHISSNLMFFAEHGLYDENGNISSRKIADCFMTVEDDENNILFYHEYTACYNKINCLTLLDIFVKDNYWFVRPICKNIHDISKYLLYGEYSIYSEYSSN